MVAGKVKILLEDNSLKFRESLKSLIKRQNDMEIVGEETDPINILLAIKRYQVQVVLLALTDMNEDPGICSHLLSEFPDLLIIAVSPEREVGFSYRTILSKEELTSVSNNEILDIVRKWAYGAN